MSDNPFNDPDDADRTVMRPNPGGRRAAAARPPVDDAPPPRAQAAAEPISAGASGPASNTVKAAGLAPLVDAAAPLLQLLARLRNTARNPEPGELRERVVREIRGFEQRARDAAVPMEQLRPAHYALCASIDDVVLNTPWGGTGAWDARSLVSTFHQETKSGTRFFEILKQVRENPGRFLPVLELMYLCLSLGFMGQYRLSPRGPGEVEKLREEVYALLARNRGAAEPDLAPHWQGVAAPYRPLRAHLPVWVVGAAALAGLGGLFIWISTSLNGASDDVFARMMATDLDHMPQIVRAAPVVALPPPPPTAEPSTLDRLRTFLKPEIDQGLVAVLGTATTPLVRIRNSGMFPLGRATVAPTFAPLLERIGSALKDEQGAVLIAGYTDNQPIRTVQFPSNFALSTARAQAASAIVSRTIGDASRITVEGRGEADPVAPNTTPEGREQNRRIEITLRRNG